MHTSTTSPTIWHNRLGHPSISTLGLLLSHHNIPIYDCSSFHREHCNVGKSHELSFPTCFSFVHAPLDLIHADVWGPSPLPSIGGFRYYVLVIDHFSQFCWLYPMHRKSEVYNKFLHFKNMVENQLSTKLNFT